MKNKGFLESIFDNMAFRAAVLDSKDSCGKPDPYKAAGIAFGMRGDLSTEDILKLGRYLSEEDAFRSDDSEPS